MNTYDILFLIAVWVIATIVAYYFSPIFAVSGAMLISITIFLITQKKTKPPDNNFLVSITKSPVSNNTPIRGQIRNISHNRNPNFTGRQSLLIDLHRTLTSGQPAALTQALTGLGGIGKTQLAVEYAYRYADDYDIIWWLRAENHATLVADYAQLAERLDLLVNGMPDQREVIRAVRNKLEQTGRWLLIFDNVPHPRDLYDPDNPELLFLPSQTTGHVIITSRDQFWNGIAQTLSVRVFERPESIHFLLAKTGKKDEQSVAEDLADELGDLPLALEQAGAYIAGMPGLSIKKYLELYRKHRGEMLKHGNDPSDHKEKVHITWTISIKQVRAENPAAADLLDLIAFFAPDYISSLLLKGKGKFLEESLKSVVNNEIALGDAIACLRRFSLIESSDDTLSVHRLVQLITRDTLDESGKNKWCQAAVSILDEAFVYEKDDVQSWKLCMPLLPHAISAADYAITLGVSPERVTHLLSAVGLLLQTRAEFPDAERVLNQVLTIDEKVYGYDHPNIARDCNNLGSVLKDRGNFSGAMVCFKRALAIDEAVLGTDHPDIARDVNSLGTVLHILGNLSEAKGCFERALAIDESAYGPNDTHVARDINNLGNVLHALGNFSGAKECLERTLKIYEKVYESNHPKIASILINLGNAQRALHNFSGAEECFERALVIDENVYGSDHPRVARDVNNLGTVLQAVHDFSGAKKCFERALAIDERVYGSSHPDVAMDVTNLGSVLHSLNDISGSKECFERALAIDKKVYGSDHPDVAIDLNNLGSILYDLGDLSGAKECFERALAIDEKVYGSDHPDMVRVYKNLGNVLKALDDLPKAEKCYERALSIRQKR